MWGASSYDAREALGPGPELQAGEVFMRKAMDRTGANPPRCRPRVRSNGNGPAIGNEEGGHGILWKLRFAIT
jgi:hypothetical protein